MVKGGGRKSMSNCRPISMVYITFAKYLKNNTIMAGLITRLENNKLLSENRYGFETMFSATEND